MSLFGASNELPEGKELEALFDRFLLRFDVQYLLRPASFRAVLAAPEPVAGGAPHAGGAAARRRRPSRAVKVTDATVDALLAIRDACTAEGIVASDRRWKKTLKAVRAFAFLAGEGTTTPGGPPHPHGRPLARAEGAHEGGPARRASSPTR